METGSQYSPILVKENAGRDAVTYVSERTGEFPGVAVNDDWVRSYPEGRLAAHILGYTGAVTQEELKQEPFKGLPADSIVGKSGVELSYEEALRGKAGQRTYNVDALGRIVPEGSRVDSMGRFVDENGDPINVNPSLELPDHVTEPEPGNNLTLTIDLDLQRVVEKELDAALERTREAGYDGRGGAVVAMNPENGEILAMASRPDFDPQLFVGGISGERELATYNYLASDRSNDPFLNRAIVGGQPGASTFKIFTGIAGLAAGVIDAYTIVNDTAVMNGTGCWMPSSVSASPCYRSWRQNSPNYAFLGDHGPQNFSEAIADSNDIFFYQVADWIWNQTRRQGLAAALLRAVGLRSAHRHRPERRDRRAHPYRAGREGTVRGAARHDRGGLLERGGLGEPRHRPGRPARLPDPDGPGLLRPLQRRHPRHPARRQGDH